MKIIKTFIITFLLLDSLAIPQLNAQEMESNHLHFKLNLKVPVEEAWKLWTTEEGITKYFAPDCNVELRIGGSYEIFFFPDKPFGNKGTESSIVLSFIPEKMLSVEWGVPRWFDSRALANERFKRTYLVLLFSEDGDSSRTVIDFYHLGFEHGSDWQKVMEYFGSTDGWPSIFERLQAYTDTGEVTNWELLEWTKATE